MSPTVKVALEEAFIANHSHEWLSDILCQSEEFPVCLLGAVGSRSVGHIAQLLQVVHVAYQIRIAFCSRSAGECLCHCSIAEQYAPK